MIKLKVQQQSYITRLYICLPSSAELPDSEDTPVDNERQTLIPNLLLAITSFRVVGIEVRRK
jgi:hypothetical protein